MSINQAPFSVRLSSHIAALIAMATEFRSFTNQRFAGLLILMAFCANASATSLELPDFKGLIETNGAAVVKVTVTQQNLNMPDEQNLPKFNDRDMPEFFRRFFENMPDVPGLDDPSAPQAPTAGFGSGYIHSSDGYVVTNAHVVKNARTVVVSLPDQREFDADIVGLDERTDLAVLKVHASDLPTLQLGDSDQLEVGHWVLAIGSPFGFEFTATQGIVSALSRSLPNENYVPFIQTDVAVNPGNSGGPLFDMDGRVVGVNSQIYSRSGGYMGLSFAIPINVVKSVVRQLREKGTVSRGWLGVVIQPLSQQLAQSFGMHKPDGALVSRVTPASPAADAGVQVGDVILEFNGSTVGHSGELPPLVANIEIGQGVEMTVLRAGSKIPLSVTIRELRENVTDAAQKAGFSEKLELKVSPLSDEQKAEYGVEQGVLITEIEPDGVAAGAGLVKGDVLVSFDQVTLDNPAQLVMLAEKVKPGRSVAVLIERNRQPQFIALTLPE